MLKFKSSVIKINKKNTGFIKVPKDKVSLFQADEEVKITIVSKNKRVVFFAKIKRCSNYVGVYVPKKIMKENQFDGETKIIFEKINGFSAWISRDGRIYFPNKYCNNLGLETENVVKVFFVENNKTNFFYCRIRKRSKNNTEEYFAFLPKEFYNKKLIISKIEKVEKNQINIQKTIPFNRILKGCTFVEKDNKSALVYLGHRVPCFINTNISLREIAHYLGCFYADGTKKGNSWGICASTFEQAKYYAKMHSVIIKDPAFKLEITYTDPLKENKEELKKRLQEIWLNKTGLVIPKIYIYETEIKDAQNRNKYGSLSFREHKQLVLIYYNRLLQYLLKEIIQKKNKQQALDFICGVLEGDGAPSAKTRGHIVIATNKREVEPLIKIFRVLGWKHEGYADKENKYYIRIGSLEIIETIVLLKQILFKYYPKRRERTIGRLIGTGAAQFLLGKNEKTSPWILQRFREKGILNKNNKITRKGTEIRKALSDLAKSVMVI